MLQPMRSSSNYRHYAEDAVERVLQIRGLLNAGLPTRVIRVLLPCVHGPEAEMPPQPNAAMAQLLRKELEDLTARIAHLSVSRDQVECYLDRVV